MDERLSSNEAESILNERASSHSKAQIDMISAQLILQSWMSLDKDENDKTTDT